MFIEVTNTGGFPMLINTANIVKVTHLGEGRCRCYGVDGLAADVKMSVDDMSRLLTRLGL